MHLVAIKKDNMRDKNRDLDIDGLQRFVALMNGYFLNKIEEFVML